MTDAEKTARELLEGVHSIALKVEWQAIPSGPMHEAMTVEGFVSILRDRIAAALHQYGQQCRQEERERCLKVAAYYATNSLTARHIAAEIRSE